ncbi:Hsp33 family molecular chaperone HslO [Azonexus sp.]|uniref:Hsp33 family molecular chaperone HslO n=1 Tax=Azonexus sp. TaxID=1872668 RepID=UPI0039E2B17B
MSHSQITRFLFEGLDIRGAFVRLEATWQKMLAGRDYPLPVSELLGQSAAVTALIAGQLKHSGRLTLQLRGEGPIQMLVLDCQAEEDSASALLLRGMARSQASVLPAPTPELLGAQHGGRLLMSLDLPTAREPYQSFVPLEGETIGEIFEHYLTQSEQQPSRLFCAADERSASCLFLQKLPDADSRDADAWMRISQLAATVKTQELQTLPLETLLQRLFHEEIENGDGVRVYPPRPVRYHCPEKSEQIRTMVLSLGRAEAESILAEHGEIHIHDDICNRDYRFSAEDVAALFAAHGPQATH